jgi:hypothetical protein
MAKYKHVVTSNKVIAISTYAGKTVKGVAKCDPRDSFDEATGVKLADARLNAKVAKQRKAMAEKKFAIAQRELAAAQARMDKMASYLKDSSVAVEQTKLEVERIEKGLV